MSFSSYFLRRPSMAVGVFTIPNFFKSSFVMHQNKLGYWTSLPFWTMSIVGNGCLNKISPCNFLFFAFHRIDGMVPPAGIEPAANRLETYCSIHWATGAHRNYSSDDRKERPTSQKCGAALSNTHLSFSEQISNRCFWCQLTHIRRQRFGERLDTAPIFLQLIDVRGDVTRGIVLASNTDGISFSFNVKFILIKPQADRRDAALDTIQMRIEMDLSMVERTKICCANVIGQQTGRNNVRGIFVDVLIFRAHREVDAKEILNSFQ